jgi:hypothetical protein
MGLETERRTRIRLEVVTLLEGGNSPTPVPVRAAVFRGHSDIDYVCGKCDAVICEGIRAGALKGLIFFCVACSAIIRVPEET